MRRYRIFNIEINHRSHKVKDIVELRKLVDIWNEHGWRLPTNKELKILAWLGEHGLGNIEGNMYWYEFGGILLRLVHDFLEVLQLHGEHRK